MIVTVRDDASFTIRYDRAISDCIDQMISCCCHWRRATVVRRSAAHFSLQTLRFEDLRRFFETIMSLCVQERSAHWMSGNLAEEARIVLIFQLFSFCARVMTSNVFASSFHVSIVLTTYMHAGGYTTYTKHHQDET